jgi:hypothetical protein
VSGHLLEYSPPRGLSLDLDRQGRIQHWHLDAKCRRWADPDRYLENFIAPSWAEHMRQHERVTVADQAIEAHAFSFQQLGFTQFATHLIAA